jgi:large subunit ribosomal protein L9
LAAAKVSEARALAKRIEEVTVPLKAKAGESDRLFGSITSQDIAEGLEKLGYVLDKKQLEIDEPIKKLGLFSVTIRLHPEVEGKIKVLVERL